MINSPLPPFTFEMPILVARAMPKIQSTFRLLGEK
jgi:hypothetical protein